MELQVGKTYSNGHRARKIVEIDETNVYYSIENGEIRECGILIFKDWVEAANKTEIKTKLEYTIRYLKNGVSYTTTNEINDMDTAKFFAYQYKSHSGVSDVRIIETKTVERVIPV